MRTDFVDGGPRFHERQAGEIRDRQAGNFHRDRFGTETALVTHHARRGRHVLGEPVAIGVGLGFVQIRFEVLQQALKREVLVGLAGGFVAVEDEVLGFARKILERDVEIEAMRFGGEFHRALQIRGTGAGAKTAFE